MRCKHCGAKTDPTMSQKGRVMLGIWKKREGLTRGQVTARVRQVAEQMGISERQSWRYYKRYVTEQLTNEGLLT